MRLSVIDRDEYRQYHYWQGLQKLILPCASGFLIAGVLLDDLGLRRMSIAVSLFLGLVLVYAFFVARSLGRHMLRDLPPSLQSLLLFSSEVSHEFPEERGQPAPAATEER